MTALGDTWRMVRERGPVRVITSTSVVDALGNGLFVTINAVYLVEVVGLSPARVGVGLSIAAFVAVAAILPMGILGEHCNLALLLAVLFFCEAVLYASYAWVNTYWMFLVLTSGILICEKSSGPARRALSAECLGTSRGAAIQPYLRAISNAGISIGSLVAAVALVRGDALTLRVALLVDGATFVFAALATLRLVDPARSARVARASVPVKSTFAVLRDRRYLAISLASGLLSMNDLMLEIAVPLYLLRRTSAPHVVLTVVFVVSTIMVVLLQVQFARGTQGLAGSVKAHRLAAMALCIALVPLVSARWGPTAVQSVALVVAGMLFTAGSLWQASGAWAVSYMLAPEGKQSSYQAAFTLGRTVSQAIAPAGITLLVVDGGAVGAVVMGCAVAGVAALFGPLMRLGNGPAAEGSDRAAVFAD